jgi:hypothetical protein
VDAEGRPALDVNHQEISMLAELFRAFTIVAICAVIHTTGVVVFAEWLISRRQAIERQPGLLKDSLLLISVVAVIIVLHVIETGIWAAFYYARNLFPDYETALYFSLGSYSTIGYGDVVLPQRWRLLGGIEGLSGVLLCGVSAAFVFAILNGLFQMRIRRK